MKRRIPALVLSLVLLDQVGWARDPTEGKGFTGPLPGIGSAR